MRRRSPERQAELDKYLAICLANLDYGVKKNIGGFVADGEDNMSFIYEHLKTQIEKMHANGRLDRLQQSHWATVHAQDEVRKSFIFDKTGFRVEDYEVPTPTYRSSKNDIVIQSEYEEDDMIIQSVTLITGGRKNDFYSGPIYSPDKKKELFVSSSKTKNSTNTSITLSFQHGNAGSVFSANLFDPEIQVEWRDNQNIVVGIKSGYPIHLQVREVLNYGELTQIHYVERS